MKLRLMLWLLGLLLKRALRRKPRFREMLTEMRGLDWGIATEDLAVARHYRMSPQGIQTGRGLPVDLDLELRFEDTDTAVSVLKKPTQQAFLDGMTAGTVRLVGDSGDLQKLQKLLKQL
jgi:dsDNA-specific endonuclease/ATPase MutS2